MKRWRAVALLGVLLSRAVTGTAQTVAPGAGTLLQELKPVAPPSPGIVSPDLTIDSPLAGALPPSAPFLVRSLRLSGNTAFASSTLHALLADAEGRELTLPELNARVARISAYYHAHGYPLARALIPAQTIRDGVVEVQILESRYGHVRLENHSLAADSLLRATLSPLQENHAIEQASLDHVLLLLADIPGVASSATVQAGAAPGSSDLVVQAAPAPAAAGLVEVNNDGNRYTGDAQASAELLLYELLHHGDTLDASLLTSGRDLNYGRLSYDLLLSGAGTRLGAAYSALHYELGDTLSALEGHGTAQIASLFVRQPLLRTRDVNLYAQLQFDRKELRDHIDAAAVRTDRHLDNGTASLAVDWRDGLLGGGGNSGSLQWVRGDVGFEDATAQRTDSATARTAGGFSQCDLTLARLQFLDASDAIFLQLSGQWASGNLDPSQKLVAGGRYTVRAYAMSATSGDTGWGGTAELRHDLAVHRYGQWQLIGFFDAEHVTINRAAWTPGANDATLRGAGAGLNWTGRSRWKASASLAARLGAAPAVVGGSSRVRGWLELSKGF